MIRFGVIGTNWITDEFIKSASLIKSFKLNAVFSRTEDRAKSFAKKYSVSNTFTDLNEMAKSPLIDAVYIASPNSCHAEQAVLFLDNKKHVMCEKPFASNYEESVKMVEAAKKNNVLLMEAMKTLFMPNFTTIADNLGKVGKIRRVVFNHSHYSSQYDAYKQDQQINKFDPNFSGGSLMDMGVYCVSPAIYLFGMPKSIKASAVMLKSQVDGQGTVLLEYDDMDVLLLHSKISNSMSCSEIQGEDGNMVIENFPVPDKVRVNYRNGEIEDITRPQIKEEMYYEALEFIDSISRAQNESRTIPYDLSLSVMKVMDEARKQSNIIFPADKNC